MKEAKAPLVMRLEPLGTMFTRRNWLLRCSILINVAVILYIGSHVMIGGGNNFATGSAFIIQDQQQLRAEQGNVRGTLSQKEQFLLSTSEGKSQLPSSSDTSNAGGGNGGSPSQPHAVPPNDSGGGGGVVTSAVAGALNEADGGAQKNAAADTAAELDPNIGDPALVIGNIGEANSYVNNTNTDGYIVTGDEKEFEERLVSILKCHDRDYYPETLQRGDFWVLKNYVRADHGDIKCHSSITYTTHADYTFLDNVIPLLDRWNAPLSIALHAPGTDFQPTLDAIKYLRDCLPDSNLVRMYTTFHIYFSTKHIPKDIPKYYDALKTHYNCTMPPPWFNISSGHLYKTQKKLLYPVNVGRNIARDAALTHFILPSDVELYPNPGLVKRFLEMIARNEAYLHRKSPRVFPLSIFEVEQNTPVPRDKTELQMQLRKNKAIPFHKRVCALCHNVPKAKEWRAANETDELSVFHIGKRLGKFIHWEPIYIGTHADPHYDERLSWEGKSDKMTQGYALCVLDYEFHILDNAFLVHKPGIKVYKKDYRRSMLTSKTNQLIHKIIYPELKIMYGTRKGCFV